ncbi:MAG: hypothetical protein WCS01_03070, partial [bacterium]
AFLLLCAGACLTRSAFHLVFIIACVPFALIPRSASRRRIAVWAVCAVLLVTSLYVKNLSRFGFFGSSSWSGMNLFRIAAYSANARSVKDCVQPKRIPSIGSVVNLAARSPGSNTLNRLVQEGRLSRVAAIMPFSKITAYPEAFRTQLWHRVNAPELTEPYRKWGLNMNHEAYVSVSREYQTASTYIIRHHPRQYAAAGNARLRHRPCSATGEGMGSKQEAESTCAASCLRRIDFKITDQRKMVGVGDLRQFEVGDANPGTV